MTPTGIDHKIIDMKISADKMESWDEYVVTMEAALRNVTVTGRDGAPMTPADGYTRWIALTRDVGVQDGCIYFIGNGASAMMASHLATDFTKNAGLRAWTFNDPSLVTATGNDVAFDQVFALPIQRYARAGDLLVTISSSGNSPNVLRALEAARAQSLHLVTLSGKRADNHSRQMGDVNFYVAAERYGWVESAHQIILHYWLDQYLNLHGSGAL